MTSNVLQSTYGRLNALLSCSHIFDCEVCGSNGTMALRRSSLRPNPCADDVTLKCTQCFHIRTHGIPITRMEYEVELAQRGERIYDVVVNGNEEGVQERLEALGYLEL